MSKVHFQRLARLQHDKRKTSKDTICGLAVGRTCNQPFFPCDVSGGTSVMHAIQLTASWDRETKQAMMELNTDRKEWPRGELAT